jgi:ankyrin repeat protein
MHLLLEAGADPNSAGDLNETALFPLATARDIPNEIAIPLIDRQLKAGANADHVDRDGGTPLLLAVLYENPPAAKLLVEAGANVNRVFKRGTLLDINEQDIGNYERDLRNLASAPQTSHSKAVEQVKRVREVLEQKLRRCREVSSILHQFGAKRKAEL